MKPNTVCQIRGLKNPRQQNLNGMIVVATHQQLELTRIDQTPVWAFEPPLKAADGYTYKYAREQYLHPLDLCEDTLTNEALDRALEHV
jgi:hypothetical protein